MQKYGVFPGTQLDTFHVVNHKEPLLVLTVKIGFYTYPYIIMKTLQ